MDEITVPLSWLRQSQFAVIVDDTDVRRGEMSTTKPTLQDNKAPSVAVYFLQLYPLTQGCVQPCVSTTSSQLTTPTVVPQQVPLQEPFTDASCLITTPPSQTCPPIQNVDALSMEVKPATGKLKSIHHLTKEQEIRHSEQCIVPQDIIVPTTKVPLIQKWKREEDMSENCVPIPILSTQSQENYVQVHQVNQATQVSAESLRVCSVNSCSGTYATETFSTSSDQSRRTQVAEKPFSCNVCGKVFARAHNLKAHSQTHSGELPFPCKICRKSYSQEAFYRIHSEILSGGRPYTCEVCKKVFCNSRSFNFHMRFHSRKKVIT